MSFKVAANLAFKEGMKQGGAVILEPIGVLKVTIPDSMMGDIIGDLNKRRGRIMGTDQSDRKGYTVVIAEAPFAEMSTYAIQLRAMTQGRGIYSYEFARYEEAPAEVAQKVIADAKKDQTEE
jgi:elongation factor G